MQKVRFSSELVQENSPFALTTARIAGRDQIVFRHGAKTLSDIYRKAARAKNAPFLIDRETVTYEDLFRRAAVHAALFAKRGVGQGMRVPLALHNDADWIASFIALTSLGATVVLINGSGTDALHQVAMAECGTAIVDGPPDWETTDDLAAMHNANLPEVIDSEHEACIAFTSGSTGNPKGAILTHRGMTTGLMNMMLAGAIAARSAPGARQPMARPMTPTVLLRTPLAHVSAYMQMLLMFMVGGRVIRSDRKDICQLITDHQITSVTGISDEDIAALLAAPSEAALYPLRSIAVVGRTLPAKLRRAIRDKLPGLGVGSGYGLTETNGLVCAIGNSELDARTHAVGPLLPTVECRIARPDGSDCPAEESGQIWLRGAMLMKGYCTSHRSLPKGWFNTGDIGYLSVDGYLNVLDKKDRFLRAGGERVSCRDIEEAAREACGILDIAAVCLADSADDRLMIVVAAPGPEDFSHLKDVLSGQFPAELIRQAKIVVRKRLPRTPSGKIAYANLLAEAV